MAARVDVRARRDSCRSGLSGDERVIIYRERDWARTSIERRQIGSANSGINNELKPPLADDLSLEAECLLQPCENIQYVDADMQEFINAGGFEIVSGVAGKE